MTFSTLGTDTTTKQPVYLYKASRTQGTYIIGATGTGKSGLLENLINDDTKQGTGVIVIDPHGDLIKKVIARLRNKDELDRVILIDPLDTDYSPGINIYQCDNPLDDTQVEQAKERVLHIFTLSARERGDESLGVRVSQGILNSAYTLIDSSPVYGGTMLELPILFTEDIPRRNMVKQAEGKDDAVVDYWKFYETYDKDGKRDRADMVVNKIQEYQMNRFMRRIIGQSTSTINFRTVIDSNPGKIVLVKLRRDHPELAKLIGSLVIAQILGAALSREREGSERRQVHIYADEFQLYATEDFTFLLTECRKYGMAVTVAHQSRDFIDLKNKAATLQAVNLIMFRVIRKDADEVAGNFDTTPPPAERREVEKSTSNPFDWLVSGHIHTNPAVNRFVDTHLRKIHLTLTSTLGKFGYQIEEDKVFLSEFNSFLYRAMTSSDPLSMLCDKASLSFLLRLHDKYPFGKFYFSRTVVSWPDVELVKFSYSNFDELMERQKYAQGGYVPRERRSLYGLHSSSYDLPVLFPDWRTTVIPNWQTTRNKAYTVDEQMIIALIAMIQAVGENQFHQASAHFARLAEEKLRKRLAVYLAKYKQEHEKYRKEIFDPKYKYTQTETWGEFLSPEKETEKWNKEFERWLTEERIAFETFIKEFRDFVLALVQGMYEYETGTQRTFADMQNDMANELATQQNRIAKVRVLDKDDHIIEHTIRTKDIEQGVYGKALDDRLTYIRNRMIDPVNGYWRAKAEIEQEIAQRQAKLRQPVQPQKEVQEPLELPKRQRRYPVEPQPVQPIASSDSQLEQAIAALKEDRYWENIQKGLIDPSLKFKEWREQEAQKLLTAWLDKLKDAQQ